MATAGVQIFMAAWNESQGRDCGVFLTVYHCYAVHLMADTGITVVLQQAGLYALRIDEPSA